MRLVALIFRGDSPLLAGTFRPPLPSFPEENSQWEALWSLLRVFLSSEYVLWGGARIFLMQGCRGLTV